MAGICIGLERRESVVLEDVGPLRFGDPWETGVVDAPLMEWKENELPADRVDSSPWYKSNAPVLLPQHHQIRIFRFDQAPPVVPS